jgi:hypothetical protein
VETEFCQAKHNIFFREVVYMYWYH